MVSINTNISSLIAQNSLKNSTLKLNNAIEQMTTGYKINHAKDNAANYSITVNMSTKIGAYEIAEDNCAIALDLVSTASEALDLIIDKYSRIRALQEQHNSETYGTDSKNALCKEAVSILKEIYRIYKTTEYNGVALLGNLDKDDLSRTYKDSEFNFQIGIDGTSSSKITVITSNEDISSWITFLGMDDISEDTVLAGIATIEIWDDLLQLIYSKQAELGAVQNRLESALDASY